MKLNNLIDLLSSVSLGTHMDKWLWAYDPSCLFSVKSTGRLIDVGCLPQGGTKTRWNKFSLTTINIFIWWVMLDRLPVRSKLSERGMDLDSTLCPICQDNLETVSYIFPVPSRCPNLKVGGFMVRFRLYHPKNRDRFFFYFNCITCKI